MAQPLSWIVLFGSFAAGQLSPLPSFEVATIKPAVESPFPAEMLDAWADDARFMGGPGRRPPDRIDYRGVTLKMLAARAYHVQNGQILGPALIDSDRWDIVAVLPPNADADSVRLMLQQLLAQRFHLQLHRDTRTLPVYRLTAAKKVLKLKPSVQLQGASEERTAAARKAASESRGGGPSSPPRSFGLASSTMGKFAEQLSGYMDRPVKDLTHLDGLYDFRLEWSPRENDNFPTIFDAVETQLGLHLERGNEPIEVIVIDRADKTPTEN